MKLDRAALCRVAAALCLVVAVGGFFWPQFGPYLRRWNVEPGANGFLLQAFSKPSGATLRVHGQEVGTTPFLGTVPCTEGEDIQLEIHLPGYSPWQRKVGCRVGERLEVNARLER